MAILLHIVLSLILTVVSYFPNPVGYYLFWYFLHYILFFCFLVLCFLVYIPLFCYYIVFVLNYIHFAFVLTISHLM